MRTPLRTIAGAASLAVLSSALLAAPATAAEPAPVQLGAFEMVGVADDSESLTMSGSILFAGTGDSGTELWKTTGTPGSTTPVKDINPGAPNSAPRLMTKVGNTAYFVASTASHGRELWKSNGTPAGTSEVDDIVAGTGGASIDGIAPIGTRVVFSADVDANGGDELWVSDGTSAGTTLLKDINPAGDSAPGGLTAHDGAVYFSADDGTHGRELWKTDGTANGTVLVEDILAGSTGSGPSDLTSTGDTLVFSASTDGGEEIFRSGGDAASTYRLRDINPGANGSLPSRLTSIGGITYFSASDPAHGHELWKTNGMISGTALVKDIRPGEAGSAPGQFAALGDRIVFRADAAEDDTEVWTSDGTTAGTRLVKDVRPGAAGSNPRNFMTNPQTGTVLFNADDGASGHELWLTDGTADGTALVADIAPGSTGSDPELMGTVGANTVFRTVAPSSSVVWSMGTSGLQVVTAAAPSLSGNAVVGGTLTASAGTWSAGATLSYQWLRNGQQVPGATATTYGITPADLGSQLSVRVTGSKDGNLSTSRTSGAVGIGAGSIALAPTPRVKGTAKVGRTLKIVKATYEGGATVSRQWLRNGKAIKGSAARKASYKLRKADRGKRIQVRVTVSKPGHTTVVKTSKKTSKVKASKKSSKGTKK